MTPLLPHSISCQILSVLLLTQFSSLAVLIHFSFRLANYIYIKTLVRGLSLGRVGEAREDFLWLDDFAEFSKFSRITRHQKKMNKNHNRICVFFRDVNSVILRVRLLTFSSYIETIPKFMPVPVSVRIQSSGRHNPGLWASHRARVPSRVCWVKLSWRLARPGRLHWSFTGNQLLTPLPITGEEEICPPYQWLLWHVPSWPRWGWSFPSVISLFPSITGPSRQQGVTAGLEQSPGRWALSKAQHPDPRVPWDQGIITNVDGKEWRRGTRHNVYSECGGLRGVPRAASQASGAPTPALRRWSDHIWDLGHSEESMLLNCGVGEDSWESLGLQGDPTSPS